MTYIFWISLIIVLYTYLGYGILLYLMVRLKRLVKGRRIQPADYYELPSTTVIVAAYNEEAFIEKKNSKHPFAALSPGQMLVYFRDRWF